MSQVIAVMMLIAIAIAASVLFYAYSAGLLGSLQPPPKQVGIAHLIIEDIAFSRDEAALLTVRNIGTNETKVGSIYVDGALKLSCLKGVRISIGHAQTFTVPNVTPTQHTFKVTTLDGGGVSLYGPDNIFIIGRAPTGSSTAGSTPSTYTTHITSTITNSATSTWTSTFQTNLIITSTTASTVLSTSSATSTVSTCKDGSAWPCTKNGQQQVYTTTSYTTIASVSSAPTTQILTTSVTSTGTTTQLTTRTTTTTTTVTSSFGPVLILLTIFSIVDTVSRNVPEHESCLKRSV
jgi:hypothetical protein